MSEVPDELFSYDPTLPEEVAYKGMAERLKANALSYRAQRDEEIQKNTALKAEVARLRKELDDARKELLEAADYMGGLVRKFLDAEGGEHTMHSDNGHLWGCPTATTPGAKCDCNGHLSGE